MHFQVDNNGIASSQYLLVFIGELTTFRLPKSSKFFVHKNFVLALGVYDLFSGVIAHKDVRGKVMQKKVSYKSLC